MEISDWLLDRLRCPVTGGRLRVDSEGLVAEDGRRWPLADEGFPDLYAAAGDPESRRVEEANVSFHDACADAYDEITVRPGEDYGDVGRILEELRERAPADAALLDAGCGSGVVLSRALGLFPRVAGIDVSRAMLARCLPLHPDLVRASVLRLPFRASSFDGVTAYSLLHHLKDPAEAFREIARVLRPGGFLYTDNDSNRAFHERFQWWLDTRRAAKRKRTEDAALAELERVAEYHHGHGLDAGELQRGLRAAGFSQVEVTFHHPPRPDEFTKLLIALERHEPAPSLRYYVRIVAIR